MKKLNKPFRTPDGPKKFAVYVKDEDKTKKVTFGDPDMEIKRDDPAKRKAFRSRHDCDNPGPKTKARYWSCKFWSGTPVSKLVSESNKSSLTEPAWVADEDLWTKAKTAAAKAGASDLYAMTTYIYKKMGGEIKAAKQAASVTTHAAVARAQEKNQKPIAEKIAVRFTEAASISKEEASEGKPTKFRVALIQEGLGNLRDGFYYSKDAIKSGVQAFEGRKAYADHPSLSEEHDRPERSVRDIVGHFENLTIKENDDSSLALHGDLVIPLDTAFDWARALLSHSVDHAEKFPDLTFIGLSINASGDATAIPLAEFEKSYDVPASCLEKMEKAKETGLETIKLVSKIEDAISCDLVTEPGAKGKVISILESKQEQNKMAKKLKETEDKEKKLPVEAIETDEEKKVEEKKENDSEDHEDIEKDKELILDMIRKHMGDDEELDETAKEAALEAYEAYKEIGETEEEAMKCAAKAMKLAKHMAEKEAAKADDSEEEKPVDAKEADDSEEEEKKEGKKESAIIRLSGRVAFLERELKKRELADFLDRKLKESGLGRAETDKIRKIIGDAKSETEITKTIRIFKEAFESRSESAKGSDFFVTMTEKASAPKKEKAKVSFDDCI